MSSNKEQAVFTNSGRRVQFDASVQTPPNQKKKREMTSPRVVTTRKVVRTVSQPPNQRRNGTSTSTTATAISSPTRKPQRSWSPLRRTRRPLAPPPLPPQPLQPPKQPQPTSDQDAASELSGMSSSHASSSQVSITTPKRTSTGSSTATAKVTKTRSVSPRRRGWFGRSHSHQQSQHKQKLKQQQQQNSPKKDTTAPLETVAELSMDDSIHRETQKLVRTLCAQSNSITPKPLSAEAVQEAYLAALELRESSQKSPQELQEAQSRVKQLQMELKAAQKAAAQLASKNLVYEENIKAMAEDLEKARSRVHELENASRSWDDSSESTQSLRDQLRNAKSALMEMQAENDLLKKKVEHARAWDDQSTQLSTYDSVNDSFEMQLRLQKDLAKVMARVHRLEDENAQYAEKQSKMEEIIRKVDALEQEKENLSKENETLKKQLEAEKAETARAREAAKSAPSHKDMVLSSSQLATATTIIGRLTEECKTLTNREKELKEKLKRLETKNKNQKEIFSTALEIKQVEIKIYEQESKMNARKVEELNKTIDDLHYHQSSTATASQVPSSEDVEAITDLRNSLRETADRLEQAEANNQQLEDKIDFLQAEVEDRKTRIKELEELIELESNQDKSDVEKQAAQLAIRVQELSRIIKGKEEELQKIHEELEDERKESEYRTQVRVNELTEQLNDYEMSLEDREVRIHQLEAKLTEKEHQLANMKTSPRSVMSCDDDDSTSQHSAKLEAIRRKMGTYENLMRAKMSRIQEGPSFHNGMQDTSTRTPTSASTLRGESPPPMMVFATPVPDTRVVEMEASLKASDKCVTELRAELADAQRRLAQLQQSYAQESNKGYEKTEESLERSEAQIVSLKEQLDDAMHRLNETEAKRVAEQNESKSTIARLSGELQSGQSRLEKLQEAFEESGNEVVRLRAVVADLESKVEEIQNDQNDFSREESTVFSMKDQAAMNALEDELEEARQRFDDACDRNKDLTFQLEVTENERNQAIDKLQQAEVLLLERQSNIEDLLNELDEAKSALERSQNQMQNGHLAQLEAELKEAKERVSEADMKIEMLEQFIEEETAASVGQSLPSSSNRLSPMQAEADIKRKDEEMRLLREEMEKAHKELLRSRERIENLEMERNYSTAKLKELSGIVKAKSGSEAEIQLYNKCIECAELSADKDDLSNKLRASEATIKRLEQEVSATKGMVNDLSQSWDTAASADENVSRLKREHGESVTRAATLSIQLAESQMKIDQLADKLATVERLNKSYAEELNGRPGILRAMTMTRSRSNSRHASPERKSDAAEMRKLKQRIALLEDQNAAYEASLTAFSSLHENMQMAK